MKTETWVKFEQISKVAERRLSLIRFLAKNSEMEIKDLQRRIDGLERALNATQTNESMLSLAEEVGNTGQNADWEAATAKVARLEAELADVQEQLAARNELLTRVKA